jgi:hypothetical protein
MMEKTYCDLEEELNRMKNEITTLKKMKNMVDNMLNVSLEELKTLKTKIKFIEISDVLKKDGYKLLSVEKNENGYDIEYQKIDDETKTFKMMYNNYKYYNCRAENAKTKKHEEDYYNKLVRLFGSVKRQIKLEGLKLKRPLFIDFEIIYSGKPVYIEIDESRRHFVDDQIQNLRDLTKDNYINKNNLKLLRIDPINSDFSDNMITESINKLFESDTNILKIGERYWNN